jgi:hypothetical protein
MKNVRYHCQPRMNYFSLCGTFGILDALTVDIRQRLLKRVSFGRTHLKEKVFFVASAENLN